MTQVPYIILYYAKRLLLNNKNLILKHLRNIRIHRQQEFVSFNVCDEYIATIVHLIHFDDNLVASIVINIFTYFAYFVRTYTCINTKQLFPKL
jgi:hypothetical protein